MTHSFDVDEADRFGVPEAILLQSLRIWQAGNAANGMHFHRGRTWVRMPVYRMLPYFKYWKTERTIYRILKSLVKQKALLVDNFNIIRRNRTRFYSIADLSSLPLTDTVSPVVVPVDVMNQLQMFDESEDGTQPNEATPTQLTDSSNNPELIDEQGQLTDSSNANTAQKPHLTDSSNGQLTDLSNGETEPDSHLTKTSLAIDKNVSTGIIVERVYVKKDEVSSGGERASEKPDPAQPASPPPRPSLSVPHAPDFVQQHRQQIESHQHIDPDHVWCRYLGQDQSKVSLKKTILELYRGARGEAFAMQNKVKIEEWFVDAFIKQRAINEDIPTARNLHRILEYFASDMREAAQKAPANPQPPSTPYDRNKRVDFGNYEID